MKEWFEGKTVAVVGNAASLIQQNYGKEIDQAEVVVRINRGGYRFVEYTKSMGNRLDVWCMQNAKQNHPFFHKPHTRNVRKMQMDTIDVSPQFIETMNLIYNKTMCDNLSANLSKKPSTGLRVLDYVSMCDPKEVFIYGFDWKQTYSWHERRKCIAHNFTEEREYCEKNFLSRSNYKLRQ